MDVILPTQSSRRTQQNQHKQNSSPGDRPFCLLFIIQKVAWRTAAGRVTQSQKRHPAGNRQIATFLPDRRRRRRSWCGSRRRRRRRFSRNRGRSHNRRFSGSFFLRSLKHGSTNATIMINRTVLVPTLSTANHPPGFHTLNNTR